MEVIFFFFFFFSVCYKYTIKYVRNVSGGLVEYKYIHRHEDGKTLPAPSSIKVS